MRCTSISCLLLVAGCRQLLGFDEATVGSDGSVSIDAEPDAAADGPAGKAAPFALTGEHWLSPCVVNNTPNANACTCADSATLVTRIVGGGPGERWHVTIRIRGVMEYMGYTGGTAGPGNWYVGGMPGDSAQNYFKLTISSPDSHFYLNSGSTTQHNSWLHDYEATFDLDAAASVIFESNGQDSAEWEGVDPDDVPLSVAGITDPPQPYNGQFAQLDVIAADPF